MHKFLPFLLSLAIVACSENPPVPKPHAYPRVYYPQKKYISIDSNQYFSFLIPEYAKFERSKEMIDTVHSLWYNINYLPFNATLHLTYNEFKDRSGFERLFEETRKFVFNHDIKADDIVPVEFKNVNNGTSGIVYEIAGNTATNINFYVSDSKKSFLSGALYFNSSTQIDSIEPVLNFIRKDINKMIETTKFK